MRQEIKQTKLINLSRSEFLRRLFFSGHATEKIIFVLCFGFFCFIAGFGLCKTLFQDQNMLKEVQAFSEIKKETHTVMAEPENLKNKYQEEEHENRRSIASVPEFYFTIRIGSTANEAEAQEMSEIHRKDCGQSSFKFSEIHQRFLVYCGHFDDIYTANTLAKSLKTDESLIIRSLSESN